MSPNASPPGPVVSSMSSDAVHNVTVPRAARSSNSMTSWRLLRSIEYLIITGRLTRSGWAVAGKWMRPSTNRITLKRCTFSVDPIYLQSFDVDVVNERFDFWFFLSPKHRLKPQWKCAFKSRFAHGNFHCDANDHDSIFQNRPAIYVCTTSKPLGAQTFQPYWF